MYAWLSVKHFGDPTVLEEPSMLRRNRHSCRKCIRRDQELKFLARPTSSTCTCIIFIPSNDLEQWEKCKICLSLSYPWKEICIYLLFIIYGRRSQLKIHIYICIFNCDLLPYMIIILNCGLSLALYIYIYIYMYVYEPYLPLLQTVWTCHDQTHRHDDVSKWKHFPRYWPFVWGIHRL